MNHESWLTKPACTLPGLSTRARNVLKRLSRSQSLYTVAELFEDLKYVIYYDTNSQWPTGFPFEGFGVSTYLEVRKSALEIGFKPEGETDFLRWEPKLGRIGGRFKLQID